MLLFGVSLEGILLDFFNDLIKDYDIFLTSI
jgi:hypothetical protein